MSYAAISLGIFIFIFAYFSINAPKNTSKQKPQETKLENFCETVDPDRAETFKAPADNASKTETDDDELLGTPIAGGGCGGTKIRHVLGDTVTYKLIRKNVPMSTNDVKKRGFNWNDESCHFDSIEKLDIDIPEIDKTKFKVFYPEISGEISLDREIYSRTRGRERNLMYFIDYGLIFLLHINTDGSFTELKGGTTNGSSETFYLVDIYQDIDSGRPELPDEAFTCDTTQGAAVIQSAQVLEPTQDISNDTTQLQLKYFVFGTGQSAGQVVNGWGVHCKPAVYLYPKQKQLINVKVNPKGELTYTDPPYDKEKGWIVNAHPDGSLLSINHEPITNNYLYYESKLEDRYIVKPRQGWIVIRKEEREKRKELGINLYENENLKSMEQLFNEILPKLGLNEKEQKDFTDYWLNQLPDSPYYFVGIIDKTQRDYLEPLTITPNPNSSIRFSLYFEMLNQPINITPPTINTPKREGFTIVDWGGMVKLHPDTSFTCSQ